MAIRTQQFNILGVGFPILEAPTPCVVPIFGAQFCAWINMIYIKCAIVFKSALHACAAKILDERQLSFPVSDLFVSRITIPVPIRIATTIRTKTSAARRTALQAFSGTPPSCSQIASLAAIFAGPFAQPICVHGGNAPTSSANYFDLLSSHKNSLNAVDIYSIAEVAKYFDIACRRIEQAYKQRPLFEPEPTPPKQEALL